MYDAAGVRRAAGRQAACLNRILDDFYKHEVQEIGEYSRLVGEENLRIVLDTFDCSLNQEVESFLVRKAVQADLLKSAITYLVFDVDTSALVGYFTLVLKPFSIARDKLNSFSSLLILYQSLSHSFLCHRRVGIHPFNHLPDPGPYGKIGEHLHDAPLIRKR